MPKSSDLDGVVPALMSVAEAAKILGMSRNGVYTLIRNGTFPIRAFKIGGSWKLKRADVDDYLADPSTAGRSTADPSIVTQLRQDDEDLTEDLRRVKEAIAALEEITVQPNA